jgi:uncharacterized protein (TIGR02118 family)
MLRESNNSSKMNLWIAAPSKCASKGGKNMATKLVVLYPYPEDVEAFERAYINEHVPLVAEKVPDVAKYALSRAIGAPEGTPPFYLIAELYFPSVEALQDSFPPQVAQELGAHAASISTGGAPVSFICTEETVT